jgi:hypothetical protein
VSTQINVTVGSGGLSERIKQQQEAARQAQLEKERLAKIKAESTEQREAKQAAEGITPNGDDVYAPALETPRIVRRPTASRTQEGAVLGVEWRIEYSSLNPVAMTTIDQTEFMTLTVGPPGQATSASVQIPNSRRQAAVAFYYDLQINEDKYFTLPIGKQACIFIYHRNFLRSIDFANIGGTKEQFSVHEVYAFVVSRTAVRQIPVPAAVVENLTDIYPNVTVNSTRQQIIIQAPDGTIILEITVDAFSETIWAADSRYGNAINYSTTPSSARASVLALQYGILNADASGFTPAYSQYLTYFTAAVYTFLKGPMVLDANALSYEYMRSNYFGQAPRFFLKRCALPYTCTSTNTAFNKTQTQPTTIDSVIPETDFTAVKRYNVPLNSYEQTGGWLVGTLLVPYPGLVFAWDWDKPNYCRQQALSLGFTGSDLTP